MDDVPTVVILIIVDAIVTEKEGNLKCWLILIKALLTLATKTHKKMSSYRTNFWMVATESSHLLFIIQDQIYFTVTHAGR